MAELQDRVDFLEALSGLKILINSYKTDGYRKRDGKRYRNTENTFLFYHPSDMDNPVKSVNAYKKARVFAEGIDMGRKLGIMKT